MVFQFRSSLPPFGMPLKDEIGERPEKKPMSFPSGPPPEHGSPTNDPTDDPQFPRSFQMIPSYVIEDNRVTTYPTEHQLEGNVGNTLAKGIRFTTDAKIHQWDRGKRE